jgi:hypothetical protein
LISSREFTKFGTTSNGSWVDKTYTGSAQLTTMNSNIKTLTRGNKQFELCNHLGNVLVTIQDRKRSVDLNADNAADYYMPYLRTVTNYYAFGSAMPGIGGSVKECSVSSSTATLKKFPYYHNFSNDSTSGFTPGSGARTVSNPTHNVLHLESVWNTRPLANKSIYLKNGVTYDLKFNIAGFSVVSGYSHTVKVRVLLPGSVLSYTYTSTGNQTINFTSNTTGYVTVEISSQINGTGSYSINPFIDIDNFNLSWDSTYITSVNNCGTNPENYKYGFNTQEKDNEIAGDNNIYTAEYWEYDARVARRWNVDPKDIVSISPYSVLKNSPNLFKDKFGDTVRMSFDGTKGKLQIWGNTIENPIYVLVGEYDAHNKVASDSKGKWEDGTYQMRDKNTPNKHGDAKDKKGILKDSRAGAYGIYGDYVAEAFTQSDGQARDGMAIHSGRSDDADKVGGVTNGCIRVSENTMKEIDNAIKKYGSFESITIINNLARKDNIEITKPYLNAPLVKVDEEKKELKKDSSKDQKSKNSIKVISPNSDPSASSSLSNNIFTDMFNTLIDGIVDLENALGNGWHP